MPEGLDPSHVPQNVEQVDQLLAHIEAPQGESPMEAAPTQPEPVSAPEATTPAPEPEYEIVYRGQTEKLPVSKLRQFAQMGRDYSEKMGEFNRTRQKFEQDRQTWQQKQAEIEKLASTYGPIDEYMKQNPDFREHVIQSYQQRMAAQPHGQLAPLLKPIQEKLAKTEEFISSIMEEKKAVQAKAEDEALGQEIKAYREKYSDFDWDSLDNNNLTLEQRVIQHAIANNIGTFRAAANDLLHDELLKRAALKSKEEIGKDIQKKTKLGLGPVTKQPTQKLARAKHPGASSYDDLANEALRELGIA